MKYQDKLSILLEHIALEYLHVVSIAICIHDFYNFFKIYYSKIKLIVI